MFYQDITSCYVASTSKQLLVQVRHTRNVLVSPFGFLTKVFHSLLVRAVINSSANIFLRT